MSHGPSFFNLYRHNFARIAVAVPRAHVADPASNARETIALMREADADHAAVTLFPELGLSAYSCDDFYLAQGAPIGYDTYITPMVPSCLEPIDIRVEPTSMSFLTKAGTSETQQLQIINNGSTDPITVSSYQFLAGSHATLSVSGPAVPFDIPVGQIVSLDVTFAPAIAVIASGTLQIASNDPDEPTLHQLLGWVYDRTWLKELAAESFAEAHFLATRH